MRVKSRQQITEEGDTINVLEWVDDTHEYERIVCESPVDDDVMIVRGFKPSDEPDRPSFQTVFELRKLSFTPISVMGVGEHNKLCGLTQREAQVAYNEIPRDILLSLHSLGFAAVPPRQEWLDGL